ncbi:MAG: YbhN family protein [Gammaproteobacteria bacterium]|tara:strand:+ start:30743 stop:31735 length:993 start_codon:yes stop_codon:yes gene_type:complete
MKKKIFLLLKIIIVLLVIFFLINYEIIDLNSFSYLLNFNIVPAALLLILTIPISTFIWWNLLRDQKYNINYKTSFLMYSTGVFFNLFMPGGAGGDVIKSFYLYKYTEEKRRTASVITVIIARIIGLHSMLTLCIFASLFFIEKIFFNQNLYSIFIFLYLIYGTFIFIIFLLFYIKKLPNILINIIKKDNMGRFREVLVKIINILNLYRNKKKLIFKCWLISIFNHIIFASAFYLVAKILKLDFLSIAESISAITLSIIANSVPITPGGIGVGESTYNYFTLLILNNSLYSDYAFGTIFFITLRILFSIISLFCGISFIMLGKPKEKYTNT